jgi:hypothetical protein
LIVLHLPWLIVPWLLVDLLLPLLVVLKPLAIDHPPFFGIWSFLVSSWGLGNPLGSRNA